MMFNKPKFKPHFRVEVVEPNTVYLLSEQRHFALNGRLYVLLAKLLDGRHTFNEIVQHLQAEVSIFGVYSALTHLESQGYLTETCDTLRQEVAAFWSLLDIDSREALIKLQNTKISVTAFGVAETETLISALKSLNIGVSDAGNFTVVLTDDYLQLGLNEFNQQALQTQKPWLLVKPVGAVIWVGPLFVPGQTGCWECLAQRLRGNREVETALQQQGIAAPFSTSRAILPTSFQMGVNWAAMEIAKWLVVGKHQQLEGKLLTFDLISLSMQQQLNPNEEN